MSTEPLVFDHTKNQREAAAEPVLVVRTFQAEIAADGDGRTLEGMVIPFNVEATVADPPNFEPYRESIAPGAFRSITNAPNRVLLDFEHYGAQADAVGSMGSIAGTLGHAVSLQERGDGLWGQFRVLRGADGDKALELAREGVLGGFSAAMRPLRSTRTASGVLQRLKVHLDRVSLCRVGAYDQARVMAIRTEQIIEEADMDQPLDPVLASMLARFVTVPNLDDTLLRAFTEQPWDGTESRWPDAASYCRSCLVDNNPAGQPKTKDQCHFPVREPGSGDINVNALQAVVGGRGAQASFPGAAEGIAKAQRLLAQHEAMQANQ